MVVKLLVPICGPCGSFQIGAQPDLPEVLAKALVKDGHAVSLEVVLEVKIPEVKIVEVKLPEFKDEIKSIKPKSTVNRKK
jgi:hypothetical protein